MRTSFEQSHHGLTGFSIAGIAGHRPPGWHDNDGTSSRPVNCYFCRDICTDKHIPLHGICLRYKHITTAMGWYSDKYYSRDGDQL